MKEIRNLIIVFSSCFVFACGGGTSSGGNESPPPTPDITPPEPVEPTPTTIPGESAVDCMANIQVRLNRTALVQNICSYSINVGQMNSRFPDPAPITEIPPGETLAIPLGDDSTSIGFGACRAPSIPEPSSPGFFVCSDVVINNKQLLDDNNFRGHRTLDVFQ